MSEFSDLTDSDLSLPGCAGHIDTAQKPLGNFSPGRYAWLLSDIRPIRPIYVGGRQGLWNPDPDLVGRVRDVLERSWDGLTDAEAALEEATWG